MTENELLKELEKLVQQVADQNAQREPGTFTSGEFAKSMGCNRTTARKRLAILMEAGQVEAVKGVPVVDPWGTTKPVCGWKLIQPKKK